MKLLLIAGAMIEVEVLMIIHILKQRYKRKRIAEIDDKLKGRYKNDI